MKSPMIEKHGWGDDPDGHYTDLRVLCSAAGFYVGTLFEHTAGDCKGLVEPGSRDSDYFAEEDDAAEFLRFLQGNVEDAHLFTRTHP